MLEIALCLWQLNFASSVRNDPIPLLKTSLFRAVHNFSTPGIPSPILLMCLRHSVWNGSYWFAIKIEYLCKFSFGIFSLKTDCSPHPCIHLYYLTYSLKGNDKVDIKLLNFSGKSGLQNGRASWVCYARQRCPPEVFLPLLCCRLRHSSFLDRLWSIRVLSWNKPWG